MITDFERIPDVFVEKYRPWLEMWAKRYRQWGNVVHMPLHSANGTVLHGLRELDDNNEPSLILVTLKAELRGNRMVVLPQSERDADLIARHVAALLQ